MNNKVPVPKKPDKTEITNINEEILKTLSENKTKKIRQQKSQTLTKKDYKRLGYIKGK